MDTPSPLTRRSFLAGAAAAAGAAAFPSAFLTVAERAAAMKRGPGYGPLVEARDRNTDASLLYLPKRFKCWSFGWTGEPMDDGTPTPDRHDGMAVVAEQGSELVLVRNHERVLGVGPFAPSVTTYDPGAPGGTTTLRFDTKSKQLVSTTASLTGTLQNCAGGPTPWGSWLTCEENDADPSAPGFSNLTQRHGFVFEVPANGVATGEPLTDMGRFVHEACAVDPATGNVYQTEDEGSSGFYRFVPTAPGDLAAGGTLSMLAVVGEPGRNMNTGTTGDAWDVEWVPIPDPDPDPFTSGDVYAQGAAGGGAFFRRGEGCWYGDGLIYFVATTGGSGAGQVFAYDPAAERLRLLLSPPHTGIMQSPDNVTVSPRGGVLLCEDGNGANFLQGLAPDGEVFRFAQNRVVIDDVMGFSGDFSDSEFAGACWSPDGKWLFVNVQTPGITLAIKGPFKRGPL